MRTPFFSLAASSSRTTHLTRHQSSLATRRRIPSCEYHRVDSLLIRLRHAADDSVVGVTTVAIGHDRRRPFTTSERPPGGKNAPSKNNKKKSSFRTSNDNSSKESREPPPPPPPFTSSSHRRRLVVAKNNSKENVQDKNTKEQTTVLGTFKATSLVSKETRDSYGQLILKPSAATGISAAAQWQNLLRNYNQTKTSNNSDSEKSSAAAAALSTNASAHDSAEKNPSTPPRSSSGSTTRDGNTNHHHHPFPILNASVLLDTQRYIVRSGKFSATTTKSGTDAARRMLRGRKEWLQTVRKHVARGQHPTTTTTSSNSSSSHHKQGEGAYEIQGHGVPRQLLQNHMDFASRLLKRHRAWSVEFGAPPTLNYISSSTIFHGTAAAEDWTMQVLGMDGDPSSYRTAPVLKAEVPVNAPGSVYDSAGDNYMPQNDDESSLQLYLTVMHRIATTLSIVFRESPLRQQQQPQEQQQPENTSTVVEPTSLSSFNDEYNNAWSQSPRGTATGTTTTVSSSSPPFSYMNPTYYDWKVDISRVQCKKNSGEEFEDERCRQHDDDNDSLKNDPKTFSTADMSRAKTTSQLGWRRSSNRLPAKEPLLTVQWIWPVYRVVLNLQGQSSLSSSSSSSLLDDEEEEHNPVVTMKYAATFHPHQQQMSSRGRFS